MSDNAELKFKTHDLNIQCYSASNMKLEYAGNEFHLFEGKVSKEKTPADENRYPNGKSGSYNAFAGPVNLKWRSRDGSQHATTINLDEIFKDRKVLHKEDPSKIYMPMPITGNEPTIIIEINDRTVNVYMFVAIQLVSANTTKRDESDNRTLAFSKTF